MLDSQYNYCYGPQSYDQCLAVRCLQVPNRPSNVSVLIEIL
jgi:hypothetical protein